MEAKVGVTNTGYATRRHAGLFVALVIIVSAGLFVRIASERQRKRERDTLSTSELRVLAMEDPVDPGVHSALADRYLFEERNEDALREAATATKLAPKNAQAFYLLGKAYQRNSDSQRALSALTKAVELDPNHVRARFLLGHGCYWGEQPLLAAKHFEIYVEKQPADDIGFRFLGLARMRLGQFDAAEPALKRAVELGKDSSGNHKALGDFYLARSRDKSDFESAAAEYKQTLEILPSATDVHVQLGQAMERLGKLPEAAEEYQVYFSRYPTDQKACFSLARIISQLKQPQRAAYYRELYARIIRARDASSAVTARGAGEPSNPLQ